MTKLEIPPTEIFKGNHDSFYKSSHKISIGDDSAIEVNYTDYNQNSLLNPHQNDQIVITEWKKNTKIQFQNKDIPFYKGKFNVPLQYCIIKHKHESFLLIIGSEELQPMLYRICVEEIWKL